MLLSTQSSIFFKPLFLTANSSFFLISQFSNKKKTCEHHQCKAMCAESFNSIVVRQHALFCFFMFLACDQPGCQCDPHAVVSRNFNWFEHEQNLNDKLFCNVHRMDKNAFCKLLDAMLPNCGGSTNFPID